METLIIRLDSPASKSKLKQTLKMFQGVTGISEKFTIRDIEDLADDKLAKEMRKTNKSPLLSYEEGMKEFDRIEKKLRQ